VPHRDIYWGLYYTPSEITPTLPEARNYLNLITKEHSVVKMDKKAKLSL
jgi:hypothetical protein